MKGDILMYSGKLKFYYNKESNELIIADKDMVVVDNLFTDKIAVHTPTQEDRDFVVRKLGVEYYNMLATHGKDTCICLNDGEFSTKNWCKENNYHLITIDQFRAMFKEEESKQGKVYIRGCKNRGGEVRAKFDSLGGVNTWKWDFGDESAFFFLSKEGHITYSNNQPQGCTEILLDEPDTEEQDFEDEYEKYLEEHGNKSLNSNGTRIGSLTTEESEPNITELKSDKTDSSGYKQSENKLSYELDWNFITQMAERMESNKGKYEPYNWKKPIDTQELRNAITRHAIEIAKGNFDDDGRPFGHLEALACNSMMLNFQLQNKK